RRPSRTAPFYLAGTTPSAHRVGARGATPPAGSGARGDTAHPVGRAVRPGGTAHRVARTGPDRPLGGKGLGPGAIDR
ncbi:hypothetical protein, partial [Micromonospora foliorum]|uniref:hypothetical protein n=1 Tax=Micromonospora foliorum TaxID=2911210 RepID=UPI001EE8703F